MSSETIPHIVPGVWLGMRADRFARSIVRGSLADAKRAGARIALLGMPSDLGTTLNHGRAGSALGPAFFRAALTRIASDWDAGEGRALDVPVWDAGDVAPAPGSDATALHETHRRVSEATRAIVGAGLLPVCVGGSHDLTFAGVRGASQAHGAPFGGINVDAHLDVRDPNDEPGSGMPFRALIDGGFLDPERFVEYGVGRFINSREHVEWATSRGVTIIGVEKALEFKSAASTALMRISRGATEPAFVSIDLDAIDGSHAPGVSAMNPMGLDVAGVARLAEQAGRDPRIRYLDIMELAPPLDSLAPPQIGPTSRVAATLLMHFLAGFAERGA